MKPFRIEGPRPLTVLLLLSSLVLAPGAHRLAAEEPAPAADAKRDAVDLCWSAFEPAEWGKMTDCLQEALKREEAALKAALAEAAAQAEQSMDKKSAKLTLEKSNATWAAYRDAECDRQLAFVMGRNHPDIGELGCKIRQTAKRVADLKFDE